MKRYDEKKAGNSKSIFVSTIAVDTETDSMHFENNSPQNYKSLKSIFVNYKNINTEGQTPIDYSITEREASQEIILTGNLKELIGLLADMQLISEETQQDMIKFVENNPSRKSVAACHVN